MSSKRDVEWFNSLSRDDAITELLKCCGARRWAQKVAKDRPFRSLDALITKARDSWWSLEPSDWFEAFRSHPKIGEKHATDTVSAQSQQWSGQEQAGIRSASQESIDVLATLNRKYEKKFGFIFIVCATGKSSKEMLAILQQRLENDRAIEIPIAAAEQAKITELRLKKLFAN
jgi:OHCU decarboxylase